MHEVGRPVVGPEGPAEEAAVGVGGGESGEHGLGAAEEEGGVEMERVGEQSARRLGEAGGRKTDLERGGCGVVVYPGMQLFRDAAGGGLGGRFPGEVDLDSDVAGVRGREDDGEGVNGGRGRGGR